MERKDISTHLRNALTRLVLGANLLGDGLRDLLDPTLRNVERL